LLGRYSILDFPFYALIDEINESFIITFHDVFQVA
jgi:hypothetical protein